MTNAFRSRAALQSSASVVLLLLFGSLSATPAFTQSHRLHNRIDLFAEGGGSFFTPGQTQLGSVLFLSTQTVEASVGEGSLQNAGRLFVGADFWFTPRDAVQASYSYSPADETITMVTVYPPSTPPTVTSGGTAPLRMHFFSVDYLRAFRVASRWRWFLAAGLGGVDWRGRFVPSFRFAVNIGTGISFRVSPRWSLRAEYRDYMIRFPYSNPLVHNHAPSLGVVFHF